jgi:FtsP/CotA-like multicopper oxidase with cupredoxin domain
MTMTSIASCVPPRSRTGWLLAALAFAACLLPQIRPAQAQYTTPCPAGDLTSAAATLPDVPEIASSNGILKGTVVLADAQRAVTVPKKGPNGTTICVPQLQRFFQRGDAPINPDTVNPPRPGPTLRGQLGDVVEITFLNQINTLDYGDTIDLSQKGIGNGCDSVTNGSGYPNFPAGTTPASDTYPNCFHGSTAGNLHFHGTHTSPSYTADNVFLAISPSPRKGGVPTETAASVQPEFDAFFANCKAKLNADNLLEWPPTWKDMSAAGLPKWLTNQQAMLAAFDVGKPPAQQIGAADDKVNTAGGFPQYYIGSFPYCFLLPKKPITETVDQGKMRMGQSPGTMWYHAHKHGSTAMDVSNGMVGAFIIEDNSPQGYDGYIKAFYAKQPNNRGQKGVPNTLWPIKQTVMVVNQVAGTPKLETASPGGPKPFSVNGYEQPLVSMYPGEVQMWRIVNGSTISGFYLPALPPGFTWRQTAQDGVQFDTPNYKSRAQRPVFLAAGNRIDLLVQAPVTPKTGQFPVLVTQGVSQSGAEKVQVPQTVLMTIELTGSGPAMNPTPANPATGFPAAMPVRPRFLDDIVATNAPERTLTFNTAGQGTGHSQHKIAIDTGPLAKFEEGPALTIQKLATIEEWKIANTTNGTAVNDPIDHPFHIHINPFQVTEVFDPNAPMQDASGHTIFTNGQATPLYVLTGTCVANQNGNGPNPVAPCKTATNQCLLDGNVASSWHPCASAPTPYNQATNIWWDVFPIPDGITNPAATTANGLPSVIAGYFKMKTRFEDYNGSYVLHCHILAHEDRGMMLQVNLAATQQMSMMTHH